MRKAVTSLAEYMIENIRLFFNAAEIQYDAHYFSNPTFIIGSGKSGTTLLQALFDNHPNLLVLPVESSYYDYYPRLPNSFAKQEMRESFLRFWTERSKFSWMAAGIYTRHKVEKQRDFSAVDFRLFRRILKSYDFSLHTRVRFYKALLESYRQSVSQPIQDILGFVDKTPVHMFHIEAIQEDFPNARFIHMLRNPHDNYYAYRTNALGSDLTLEKRELLNSYVEKYIAPSFEIAVRCEGSTHRVVRYEDLVTDPKGIMHALARWVGVPYCDTFLCVTLCGKPWQGNSSDGERFKGISSNRVGKGYANLSEEEKQFIQDRLGALAGKFGYVI